MAQMRMTDRIAGDKAQHLDHMFERDNFLICIETDPVKNGAWRKGR